MLGDKNMTLPPLRCESEQRRKWAERCRRTTLATLAQSDAVRVVCPDEGVAEVVADGFRAAANVDIADFWLDFRDIGEISGAARDKEKLLQFLCAAERFLEN